MTDTTITSEQVVYRAAKKVYSDETLHVFRAFRRTGSSNLNGTERQEHYEVVLEDWLLENLNQRYVIPEDFNAYKQLTRPTAKGIFGNLHLWFHASSGKPVEKDYADLCNLLNVQVYPHLSKIKSTMGLALNELVAIKYISRWDVQKMLSKQGYKVVLVPGDELLRVLDSTRPERREPSPGRLEPSSDRREPSSGRLEPSSDRLEQSPALPHSRSSQRPALSNDEENAEALLKQYGVLPAKAASLVASLGPAVVLDTVEYLASNALGGRRKSVDNPAGLIIYSLEKGMPLPATFVSARRKRAAEEAQHRLSSAEHERLVKQFAYLEWVESEQERAIHAQFSPSEIDRKLMEMVAHLSRTDSRFGRMQPKARTEFARRMLRKELSAEMELPSLEAWRDDKVQPSLF